MSVFISPDGQLAFDTRRELHLIMLLAFRLLTESGKMGVPKAHVLTPCIRNLTSQKVF